MIQTFTLIMQFAILIAQAAIMRNAMISSKSTQDTINLVKAYRREVEWLNARLEALEGNARSKADFEMMERARSPKAT